MESWDDDSSSKFAEHGEMFTPRRAEIGEMILRLIPAESRESFLVVDIGCGTGWLLEAVLRHFPYARAMGLDGSTLMLNRARERLMSFGDRIILRNFRLENDDWINELSEVRCFVSSQAMHHLDGNQKQRLFARLKERLSPRGGLLISDLILPTSSVEWKFLSDSWDAVVTSQSLAMRGNLSGLNDFQREEWNYYTYPDFVVDHPSTLIDQLNWLKDAGYAGIDVFWMLAGHAIFGGYKGISQP